MTVLYYFRVAIAFVNGLLFADIMTVIAAGDVISIRRWTASLVVVIYRPDLLYWDRRLPVYIHHRRLDCF